MCMCQFSCCVALSTSHHCRFGYCKLFQSENHGTLCDALYTPEVDYVYTKWGTNVNSLDIDIHTNALLPGITSWCIESVIKIWCHIFLPSCGNSSVFKPPTSVCKETCNYVKEKCDNMWNIFELYIKNTTDVLTPINCSNTGEHLDPLPYCCSDVGIDLRMFSSTG